MWHKGIAHSGEYGIVTSRDVRYDEQKAKRLRGDPLFSTITTIYMETLEALLPWIQIVLSVLLIVSVLLQQSSAGVGGIFGGSDGGSFTRTRRGFEKFLFQTTIVLAILFGLSSFLALVL